MDAGIVTAFVPISDNFVVTGDSESRLSILRFDRTPQRFARNSSQSWSLTRPVAANSMGKCSHMPVTSLSSLEQHILAASGSSVSLWDIVGRTRLRHYATSDVTNSAEFITANLLAAAGNGCQLSLFDIRSHNMKPAMSQQIASDNLYAIAVEGTVVYCGGADGNIYKIDLRGQVKEKWEMPGKDAILDLKAGPSGDIVCVSESGKVCGVGSTSEHYLFSYEVDGQFTHRVKCDIASSNTSGLDIVCGGESGQACVVHYDGKECHHRFDVPIGDGLVATVKWSGSDLYASKGNEVVLMEHLI